MVFKHCCDSKFTSVVGRPDSAAPEEILWDEANVTSEEIQRSEANTSTVNG